MSKKILAFGASNSRKSINQKLATWASTCFDDVEVDLIDLNNFEMPIFSVDRERESGIPQQAYDFKEILRSADGVLLSLSENNGSYSTAFKNIYDWASRIEKSMWLDKPMFLMATSPGKRGASNVLNTAVNDFPHRGGRVVAHFSLPSFSSTFSEKGIIDDELLKQFEEQLDIFSNAL